MTKKKEMIKLTKGDQVDVEMLDGSIVKYPREETRYIKADNKYYLPGVTCFRVRHSDGTMKWHRWNNGKIGFNVESQTWELINILEEDENLVKGIYNEQGQFGYFHLNPFNNVYLTENPQERLSASTICISAEIAEKLGYMESLKDGVWINKKSLPSSHLMKLGQKAVFKYDRTSINYNADESNNTYMEIIQQYNKHKNLIQPTGRCTDAAKLLDNYTFGFEIETCNGTIPKNLIGPLGVVPLKDGSLRDERGVEPYEYTTIPLIGEKGLETLRLLSTEVDKRCEFNEKCSVHIHISGVKNISEEFCLALYKLSRNIQNEVFTLFPMYKTKPENYQRNFTKNYCAKLHDLGTGNRELYLNTSKTQYKKNVKVDFDRLYSFLSDNTVSHTDETYNINSFLHPKGQTQKWNIHSRYFWINLVPFVFTRKRTVEFRLHTPTLNFTKLSSWLFICSAILKFTEVNQKQILTDEITYDLTTIINGYINNFGQNSYRDEYGEFVSRFLTEYCDMRKKTMKEDFEKRSDPFGSSIEFTGEKNFSFTSQGEKNLY